MGHLAGSSSSMRTVVVPGGAPATEMATTEESITGSRRSRATVQHSAGSRFGAYRTGPRKVGPSVSRKAPMTLVPLFCGSIAFTPCAWLRAQLSHDAPSLHLRPAHAEIAEARALHLFGAIDIPQVDDHRPHHGGAEPGEIERPELLPFGRDHDRVGAGGRFVGAVAVDDVWK